MSLLKQSIRMGLLPVLVALCLLGALAAGPSTPATPSRPAVNAPSDPGTLNVSWQSAEGATFYDVGWASETEVTRMRNAGRDWLDAFHFVTVPSNYTTHRLSGLTPGAQHYVIIGAKTARFGGAQPVWSGWSAPVTTTAQPDPTPPAPPTASDCFLEGTCLPIRPVGTFRGSGDSAKYVIALRPGLHRVTSSHTGDRNFIVQLIHGTSGDTEYIANEIASLLVR